MVVLSILNLWAENIKVTRDATKSLIKTSILDLQVEIGEQGISYTTYRKPTNKYAYLPYTSSRSIAAKQSIIATECTHLMLTNMHRYDYEKQVSCFVHKLHDRGVPISVLWNIATRYTWQHKQEALSKKTKRSQCVIVPR